MPSPSPTSSASATIARRPRPLSLILTASLCLTGSLALADPPAPLPAAAGPAAGNQIATQPTSPPAISGNSPDPAPQTLRQESPSRPAGSTPTQSLIVSQDGITQVTLSATGINRLVLPATITSAHTNSDAIDADLRGNTAIVTFRTPDPADILLLTTAGQYLLRLVPEKDLPSQTIRLKAKSEIPATASSYQSQLASLIEAAYRRETPAGYRVEQPGTPLALTGALQWWVAIRYRGRTLSVEEYAVYNAGALPQSLAPQDILTRFSINTRAISADPQTLQPGQWGRVFAVFPTENIVAKTHPTPQGGR